MCTSIRMYIDGTCTLALYAYTHACAHVPMVHVHACIYTYICMHNSMHADTHTHMHNICLYVLSIV